MKNSPSRPLIVASHRRSGTHMTIDFLRKQFPKTRVKKLPMKAMDRLYLNLDAVVDELHPRSVTRKEARNILLRAPHPIIKTHQDYIQFRNGLKCDKLNAVIDSNTPVIYVVRDFRNLVCSLQAYQKGFDESAFVPLGEYILQADGRGRTRIDQWKDHVESWMKCKYALFIRYEDVLMKPDQELGRIEDYLKIKADMHKPYIPPPWRNVWACRIIGRLLPSPRASTIMGRSGGVAPFKWKDSLPVDYREMVYSQLGGLLDQLGYKKDI
jgi:hypothetical protein